MVGTLRLRQIKGTLIDAEAGDFKIQVFGIDDDTQVEFAKEYAYNTADDFRTVFNEDPPVVGNSLDS